MTGEEEGRGWICLYSLLTSRSIRFEGPVLLSHFGIVRVKDTCSASTQLFTVSTPERPSARLFGFPLPAAESLREETERGIRGVESD